MVTYDLRKIGFIDGGVNFLPNEKMGLTNDGILEMITVEPIDEVIEYYGIPKLYKTGVNFSSILYMTDGMSEAHQKLCDEYLSSMGTGFPGDFIKKYAELQADRDIIRRSNEKKDEENYKMFHKLDPLIKQQEESTQESIDLKKSIDIFTQFMKGINGLSKDNGSGESDQTAKPANELPNEDIKTGTGPKKRRGRSKRNSRK